MMNKKLALILMVVVIFASACVTIGQPPSNQDTSSSQKFDEIIYKFVGEYTPLTELQKTEDWSQQYKGIVLKGTGVVKEIVVSSNLVKIEHPKHRYENGASISFRDSERDLLSKLKTGDSIRFSGRLDDYSNSDGLIVVDAVFVLSQS